MSSNFAQFIPLILIFVIFYFFLIRPQQKKVREHKTMTQNLKRGDEVITSGGIIGTVDRVFEDDRIELNISDGVKVQVIKNTIQGHLKKKRLRNNLFVLNFSKIKIVLIYLSFLAVSFFCFSNISDSNNFFLKKKLI